MKSARLIITFDCRRNCSYCCNKYSRIMAQAVHISDLAALSGFDCVCITGGEPLLDVMRTLSIAKNLRRILRRHALLYMYTTKCAPTVALAVLLQVLDGIHYTIHEDITATDVAWFEMMQGMIQVHPGSHRLQIHPNIHLAIPVIPRLWTRIQVKPWLSEDELIASQPNGLPEGETLFILDDEDAHDDT